MITAAVRYRVKPGRFEEFLRIWHAEVFLQAPEVPGLLAMQLITDEPQAIAFGFWRTPAAPSAFLATGVYERLLACLQDLLTAPPEQLPWNARYFFSSGQSCCEVSTGSEA